MNDTTFSKQFRPLPQGKVSGGYLEAGEYDGSTYQFEGQVVFYLGPDNQVWALVGHLAALPALTIGPSSATFFPMIIKSARFTVS